MHNFIKVNITTPLSTEKQVLQQEKMGFYLSIPKTIFFSQDCQSIAFMHMCTDKMKSSSPKNQSSVYSE